MTLRSILSALRPARPLHRGRRAGRRTGARPQVEILEDRCLLSANVVLHWNEILVQSLAVQPPRVPLASPWMRLTAPMASCAADHPAAKPQTSITATMISRCIMRRSAVGAIIAARTCSGTCSSARLA